MCTVTNIKPERQIATEDIVVYKHVIFKYNKTFGDFFGRFIPLITSYTGRFKYRLNKLYKVKLEDFEKIYRCYYSRSGFYSYAKDTYFADKFAHIIGYLHKCNVKCIIPKGSEYIVVDDDYGNTIYHSNQIKIIEILD